MGIVVNHTQFFVSVKVFTAMKIQIAVFLVVMPCNEVVGYQICEGPCCLHLQGEVNGAWKWT
jgi:hypothetical protein